MTSYSSEELALMDIAESVHSGCLARIAAEMDGREAWEAIRAWARFSSVRKDWRRGYASGGSYLSACGAFVAYFCK